jgi:hypothetical protein
MRYLLIVMGMIVTALGIGIKLEKTGTPGAAVGPLVAVIGGLALVTGLATCDIVNAIRARRP